MGNQGFLGEATSPRFSLLRSWKGTELLYLYATKRVTTITCIIAQPKRGAGITSSVTLHNGDTKQKS